MPTRQNSRLFSSSIRIALAAFSLVCLVAVTSKAVAQTAEEAGVYLTKLQQTAMAYIKDESKSQEEQREAFDALIGQNFDFPGAAKYIIGRYWREASQEDRDDFILILRKIVGNRFFPLFFAYGNREFKVVKTVERKKFFVASTSLQIDKGENANIFWRIDPYDNADGFIIRDVAPEGVSLRSTYREDYGSTLRQLRGDVKAFNAKLREKVLD